MSTIAAAVAERAGMDAATVAVEVNAATFAVRRPIQSGAVRKLWSEAGVLARAWVVANDPAAPFADRWRCKVVYDAIEGGTFADFDTGNPTQLGRMQAFFAALMAAGPAGDRVLTAELVAATLDLAQVTVTGADLFGRPLNESDIINLRAEIV